MTEFDDRDPMNPSPLDSKDLRLWSMLLHLSLLAGFVVPVAGLVVPIVIYVVKKDDLPGLEAHFNVVINWILSALIYGLIGVILMLILIGFVVLWAIAILTLIFSIIGAIKANDGEVWEYPLSIRFFGRR